MRGPNNFLSFLIPFILAIWLTGFIFGVYNVTLEFKSSTRDGSLRSQNFDAKPVEKLFPPAQQRVTTSERPASPDFKSSAGGGSLQSNLRIQNFDANHVEELFPSPQQKAVTSERSSARPTVSSNRPPKEGNTSVHAFYYSWYSTPAFGGWEHWNHEYIAHWDSNVAKRWPKGAHDPLRNDIGADFFPQLGPYASFDPAVIKLHMTWAHQAGVGVLVLSWYPPSKMDGNARHPVDPLVPALLDAAHAQGIRLCLHVEPYKGRTAVAVRDDAIGYAVRRYGGHPAYHRMAQSNKSSKNKQTTTPSLSAKALPVFYIYDSYHVSAEDWSKVLSPDGTHSIRGTDVDAFVIFLLVEQSHYEYARRGGFDGFYTYFAADGFTHGSSTRNWKRLAKLAEETGTTFIPSVGPGYIDTSVRPWNGATTRGRQDGKYYDAMWDAALRVAPTVVSVTSFNEWHEGTQIEPAQAMTSQATGGRQYLNYRALGENGYLERTAMWSSRLHARLSHLSSTPSR